MDSGKYKVVILANEVPGDHILWIKALEDYSSIVEYQVISLISHDWLYKIKSTPADYYLAKPPGFSELFKHLYDERLYILSKVLQLPVFPTYEETAIYENKRMLSYWLAANQIPCPDTFVVYHPEEAYELIKCIEFPVIAKTNIGASGRGVKKLKNNRQAAKYIKRIFHRGVKAEYLPRINKNNIFRKINNLLTDFGYVKRRFNIYKTIALNPQKGFLIFQEYIPHSFEWRVVRIGNSFFAHKKLVNKGKASGSLLKEYGKPPLTLLDFAREITESHKFYSQCIDIFETGKDKYLVNEMQCMFGQSDPYQMIVNDAPGRYIYKDGKWYFEAGDFNKHESFGLRVEFIIETIKSNKQVESK